ncbi:hypothetical protein JB92DRAFT_3036314 [Gautieria morchelliformis]|nr:hypothetical protein JB92DRAFT_3036314 [Gautieria morchelliformis]
MTVFRLSLILVHITLSDGYTVFIVTIACTGSSASQLRGRTARRSTPPPSFVFSRTSRLSQSFPARAVLCMLQDFTSQPFPARSLSSIPELHEPASASTRPAVRLTGTEHDDGRSPKTL